ncbi:MAG: DEAD/DEAH box helicase family protein [Patescibacteria group bacterium]
MNEWKSGLCHKLQKQKCKDCPNAKYAELNDYYIEQHLRGQKLLGIYPLFESSKSYLIAADFDGKNWRKDILKSYKKCTECDLPVYVERSKSGKGGHAWLFFEDGYPAFKSRNIVINILREANIIDQLAKDDSFDRLFPNQDTLSGKGFGNLIALPLYGKARENGNTVFLDPKNDLLTFSDQGELLGGIRKITLAQLDNLYDKFNGKSDSKELSKKIKSAGQLNLILAEQISISKINLPKKLINFLREELNFINSEFLIKKRMGVSTYKIERYFKLIDSTEDFYTVPRGFLSEIINFLNENGIKFTIEDGRKKCDEISFENSCKLYDYQTEAVKKMLAEENDILVAPPGAGKTIMGIEIIAQSKQPTLILVHKKQIYGQWLERIESFLNIPKREIGQICSGKKTAGKKITIAMLQTLSNIENPEKELGLGDIGLVLVDECHHIPAKTFRKVVTKLNPYYLYGLTATPKRKHNDEKLIYIFLGEILHEIDKDFNFPQKKENTAAANSGIKVIIKNTEIDVPFKVKVDNFQVLSKIIIFDSSRNRLIADDVIKEAGGGNKCLILTERKEHVETLSYYFKSGYEIITLTGDLSEKQKKEKMKQIHAGNFQILIATGQLIGEGTDLPSLNRLFLVYPFSFEGKLTQYIGRIQRGQNSDNIIYDYRDAKIDYLEKFYKKRRKYYEKHFSLDNLNE